MRRGAKFSLATAVVSVVAVLTSSAALAASPLQIYYDYADNGRLDGNVHEGRARGRRAERPAPVRPVPAEQRLGRRLPGRGQEGSRRQPEGYPAGAQQSLGTTGSGSLPFTGFDLALIVGGALFLLVVGGGLRRVSRARTNPV